MNTVTAEYAGNKIGEYLDAFGGYLDSPVGRVKQLRNPALREAIRILIKIKDSEGVQEALAGEGSYEQMEQLYGKCISLLKAYGISGVIPAGMEAVKIRKGNSETVERLMAQVRKFGDSRITERLMEVESGESAIVFAEMDEGIEGYTSIENGQLVYRLNKRYEQISDEGDLQKAIIVLAHELQRNPSSGDLKGETSEIVLRDVGFIERLAEEYGEKVYENNPELGVLHYIKEVLGEDVLKEFVDIAFSHERSYWKINRNGDIEDDGPAEVKDADGNTLFPGTSGGRQKVLEEWLGLNEGDGYKHFMQPAGYIFHGGKWINNPGISAEIIETARANGKLSEEGYAKIQSARGIVQEDLSFWARLIAELRESKNRLREFIQQLKDWWPSRRETRNAEIDGFDSFVNPELLARKLILRDQRILEENGSGLCYYNALVGAVEERTGINLTREQKTTLLNDLKSDEKRAVRSSDRFVIRPDVVLASALESVSMSDVLSVKITNGRPADFDSLAPENVLTVRVFDKGGHFNLGDSEGNFIWEPLEYNNPNNIRRYETNDLRYIVFTSK